MTPTTSTDEPDEPLTLCVLLWARPGRTAQLGAYEDAVLQLLADHDASVLQRVRATDAATPDEVHLLRFPSESALDEYMADERRLALADERDQAIERTEVIRVDVIG